MKYQLAGQKAWMGLTKNVEKKQYWDIWSKERASMQGHSWEAQWRILRHEIILCQQRIGIEFVRYRGRDYEQVRKLFKMNYGLFYYIDTDFYSKRHKECHCIQVISDFHL